MDHTYNSSTVEIDHAGYSALKDSILNSKTGEAEASQDIRQQKPEQSKEAPSAKKYFFQKGDQRLEVDDDYEIEFMADKRPTKLTLRELKERAAGEIAIKNRMHVLAEEKKKIQSTFKQFAEMSREDPLAALEFISRKAKESDSEFEYEKYIEKLAEQAEKLGQMSGEERKAVELEKKLKKAEQDLSYKERTEAVVRKKQELLSDYPQIGDREFGQMVDAVLNNEELLDGVEDEHGVMNKVEELIQETLTQRDLISVINDTNPDYANDNELLFSLSDQVRQNPDLDEEDIREIVRELIAPSQRPAPKSTDTQRNRDIRTLSNKARQANSRNVLRTQNAEPYDVLKEQLLARKQELSKTPLYKR